FTSRRQHTRFSRDWSSDVCSFVLVFLKKNSISGVNFELFIAKRIIKSEDYKSSISAPIIKIAITAIAIGMVMMLVAIATGIGLRSEERRVGKATQSRHEQ